MVLFPVFSPDAVENGTEEQDAHTEIQPDHDECDAGHGTVEGLIIAVMIHVPGKDLGETDPAAGRDDRAGKLSPDLWLYRRYMPVKEIEEQYHEGKDQQSAHAEVWPYDVSEKRKQIEKFLVELVSEDQKELGADQQNGKYHGVQHGCQTLVDPQQDGEDRIGLRNAAGKPCNASFFRHCDLYLVDPVQTDHQGHACLGTEPDHGDDGQ